MKKNFVKKQALFYILMLFAGIFLGALTKDVKNAKNLLNLLKRGTPDMNKDISLQPSSSNEKVCDYTEVLHMTTSEIDTDDDIQENIGYQNNKVGLYIYAEVREYAEIASELVNSNGGDWGYVLIPFNVKDDNASRWGALFDRLSEMHLIPIIQLWDLDLDENRDKQIQKSAEFLNALMWPIKPRYISVYNEPNDSKFWKGKTSPAEYAEVLSKTIDTFKALNSHFFILNGAFNASARGGGDYIDEEVFLIRMNDQEPGIFKRLDGWASHPYPQPNFSGSPKAYGRDSIRAYEWELSILKNRFGVDIEKLPVFITETGWAHKESDAHSSGDSVSYSLSEHQVADNIKYAFENVWIPDDRIVAITPFTIRYDPPFDNFSWITKSDNPYPQFNAVKDIEKVKGKPPVVTYSKVKVLECE